MMPNPPRLTAGQLKLALAALLVAAFTFVLYSGSLKNDYIGWDDQFYVLANPYITPLSGPMVWKMFSNFHFKSWTPLTLVSHAVDYSIWGLDPRGSHLVNMIFHALNAVWIFFLTIAILRAARRSTGGEPLPGAPHDENALLAGAAAAALLFAFHPLRVEAVACASSRKDLLSTFLVLPAILLYLAFQARRGLAGSWRPYVAALVLYALALTAKGAVMTLPGILIVLDIAAGGTAGGWPRWKRLLLEKIPFAFLGLAAAAVAYVASEGGSDIAQVLRSRSDYASWELGLYNTAFYLLKTIWPATLAELYTYPKPWPFALVALAAPGATLLAAFCWWRGERSCLLAWSAYVIALLPMAGFVPSSIQVIANRYAYLAAAPFCILAGAGIVRAWGSAPFRRRAWALPALLAALGAVIAALGVRTLLHIPDWRDAETVWRRTIEVSPGHALARNEMGLALLEKRDYAGAIASFARAVEIYPGFSEALCNMGGAYVSMGDTANAERVLRAALTLSPRDYATFTNLGNVRMVQHRYGEAADYYRRSLALNPAAAVTTYDLGYALMLQGRPDEGLAELRRATLLNPNYGDAYYLIGEILSSRPGSGAEALEAFRRAARLGHVASQKIMAGRGLDW